MKQFCFVSFVTWVALVLCAPAQEVKPSTEAIQEAITLLQARQAQVKAQEDKDKIAAAIVALDSIITGKPAVVATTKLPELTPALLKSKFAGKTVYNPKTGLLTFVYDFKDKKQLEDFDLKGNKPKMSNGVLSLEGGEKIEHVVKFSSLSLSGEVRIPKTFGWYLTTRKDVGFAIGGPDGNNTGLWIDNKPINVAKVPNRSAWVQVGLTTGPTRILVEYAGKQYPSAQDNLDGGSIVLHGGHQFGAEFKNLVIEGKPDPGWLKTLVEKGK